MIRKFLFEEVEDVNDRGIIKVISGSGYWSVVSGQWSVVSGQWSVVSGQWPVVSGQ